MALIQIRGATVTLGGRRRSIRALDGLDLDVDAGEHVALLGANGSGKTTLLRALAGTQPLDAGTIERPANLRLGVVFQRPALDPLLTVRENLRLQAVLFGLGSARDRIESACGAHGLADRIDDRVSSLSGGLARRVEFVRATLCEPDLLLLDEPTVGLDLPARRALHEALDRMREDRPRTAVLMTTHLMTDAERLDRVAMIAAGRVVASGTPDELTRSVSGGALVRVPAEADWTPDERFRERADGSWVAQVDGDEALAEIARELAGDAVPFFVGRPTLADAYLAMAQGRLDAVAPAGATHG